MEPRPRASRWVVPAVAAACALAAGVSATIGVARHLHGERLGVERGEPVIVLEPAWAIGLVVHHPGTLALERSGDGWAVSGVPPHPIDPAAVQRVLGDLAALRRRTTSARAGEPAAEQAYYGLAAPRVRLEVILDGGVRREVALGARSGADGTQFVRTASGEIANIPASAGAALEADIAALRSAAQGAPPASPPGPNGG